MFRLRQIFEKGWETLNSDVRKIQMLTESKLFTMHVFQFLNILKIPVVRTFIYKKKRLVKTINKI